MEAPSDVTLEWPILHSDSFSLFLSVGLLFFGWGSNPWRLCVRSKKSEGLKDLLIRKKEKTQQTHAVNLNHLVFVH